MLDILEKYDILGAFWMTIRLAFFSAIGALVIGTVLAVMRVSPVAILRRLGAFYVNTVRNTPLTLLVFFSIAGPYYILQISLTDKNSPTALVDNGIRWAIVALAVSFSMISLMSSEASATTMTEATVVFLVSAMSTEPSGATAPRKACGRMTSRRLWPKVRPIERAASA